MNIFMHIYMRECVCQYTCIGTYTHKYAQGTYIHKYQYV